MFIHLPLLYLHGAIMKAYVHCLEHHIILTSFHHPWMEVWLPTPLAVVYLKITHSWTMMVSITFI